ncbi:hypothetical protein P378_01950 [Desulforamulus profundi]|uniref:Cold-shock domain-containing protein n=1 Tax=Desulforamulus profundi TaxID=1383067 RepID=A0A2C6MIA4_9FIRM|nr:TIGR03986 family CRISPR-associated RAMP protein [Desulforamulus profundi]PHJ39534.1 hypothetical protein P378_01950 [Desulforamulus profundi]
MRGKIKFIKMEKNYGFITTQGQDYYFRLSEVKGFAPAKGLEVEFVLAAENDGKKRAKKLKLVSEQKEKSRHFFNPYNFVSPLPEVEHPFFKHQTPPSHAVYSGLTGYMACTLEVVTPLFISEGRPGEVAGGHGVYSFIKRWDKPFIPGSSLRGMIRNVYEAATNSCFAVFADKLYSRRMEAQEAKDLIPARVIQEDVSWKLQLLKGRSVKNHKNMQLAAWISKYDPKKQSKTAPSETKVDTDGFNHGDKVWALLEPKKHANKPISYWKVKNLFRDENEARQCSEQYKSNELIIIEKGWLFISGQNAENKHDERFFFGEAELIELPGQVREDYERIVGEYQKRHEEQLKDSDGGCSRGEKDKTEIALSNFIYASKELKPGDLVYAGVSGNEVKYMVPVQISRRLFKASTGELLPEYLRPCGRYEKLCPACRLFGWVKPSTSDDKGFASYAGRVEVSDGKLVGKNRTEDMVTLAELASPKPTATFFYLADSEGKARYINKRDGYQQTLKLRGRKFYRHHSRFQWQKGSSDNKRNRTIKDPVKPGSRFSFLVRFENLTEEELGALAWSIQLEEGLFHRLGYGKPLGLGSVRISIESCKTFNFQKRYAGLTNSGAQEVDLDGYIDKFKETCKEAFGKDFSELENICDLKSIFGSPIDELPVHYPRLTKEAKEGGDENFKWFMKAATKEWFLQLAREDRGLSYDE